MTSQTQNPSDLGYRDTFYMRNSRLNKIASILFRHLRTRGKYSVIIIKYSQVYVKKTMLITFKQDPSALNSGEGNIIILQVPGGQTSDSSFFEFAETRK